MCGRAKLPDDVSEIKLDLKIDFDEIGAYQPRWNAAPTTKLPVVVARGGQRILTAMHWGLVPATTQSWAQARKIGHSTINARAEGIVPAQPSAPPGQRDAAAWSLPTAITSGAMSTSSHSPSLSAIADR
jgi:putative SOS response-associated peptidase YedK